MHTQVNVLVSNLGNGLDLEMAHSHHNPVLRDFFLNLKELTRKCNVPKHTRTFFPQGLSPVYSFLELFNSVPKNTSEYDYLNLYNDKIHQTVEYVRTDLLPHVTDAEINSLIECQIYKKIYLWNQEPKFKNSRFSVNWWIS